jgi:YVTN family beta-propeller protein
VSVTPDGKSLYVALLAPPLAGGRNGGMGGGMGGGGFGLTSHVNTVDNGTLDIINTSTNQIIKTISLGRSPNNVLISPDGNYVYVPIFAGPPYHLTTPGELLVISTKTNTIVTSIMVGLDPEAIAWGPLDSI